MMNLDEAKKAMRKGKKISRDKNGRSYFVKQGKRIVCHFRVEEDKVWGHRLLCGYRLLDKSDIAFFSRLNGWFIVEGEVE